MWKMKIFIFQIKSKKKNLSLISKVQERNFVITDLAIYNFKGNDLKRRIKIEDLKAITISKLSDQFIIHGNQNEYDYLFISQNRTKIINILQNVYENLTHKNFVIYSY